MAISSGISLQKLGVAATLVSHSFVWAGVIPDDVVEVVGNAAGVSISSQGHADQQPVKSVLVGSLLEEPTLEDPVSAPLIVSVDPYLQTITIVRGDIIEEVILPGPLPEGKRVIVETAPFGPVHSFTHDTVPPDDVAIEPSSSGVEIFSQGHELQRQVTQAVLLGGIVPDDVLPEEPPEGQHIFVHAEPVPAAKSFVHGFIVPALPLPEELPEGKRVVVGVEPVPPAYSFLHDTVPPPDGVPEEPLRGAVIIGIGPHEETPSFVLPSIPSERAESARVVSITLAESPAEEPQAVLRSGVPPDDVISGFKPIWAKDTNTLLGGGLNV